MKLEEDVSEMMSRGRVCLQLLSAGLVEEF